ncbi:patatin-like phospholipase family protein [Limnobacter humi]|nr:patatin-like phospholipase family protein [Limnobacter humi]
MSTGPRASMILPSVIEVLAHKLKLPLAEVAQIAQQAHIRTLNKGEVLFKQGDVSQSFFIIASGQLKGQRRRPDGQLDLSLLFSAGDIIGELGFFDQSARTLTISARKDAVLLEIDQSVIESIGQRSAGIYQHLIRILVARFKHELGYSATVSTEQTLVFQNLVRPQGLAESTEALFRTTVSRLAQSEPTFTVRWVAVDAHDAIQASMPDAPDAVLLAVCASTLQNQDWCRRLEADLQALDELTPVWILLVHEAAWVEPNVAARLRSLCGPHSRVLHLRQGQAQDYRRAARIVLGLSRGLVLGGGGARGFAHAGLFKALDEAGIEFDWVGGTSMGALVGGLIAQGQGADWVIEQLSVHFKKGLPFKFTDYWIPRHGFIKSRAADQVYLKAFGQHMIEDLPVPYYAVACNLTLGTPQIFDTGLQWQAVRASTSIPVVFEPHVHQQQVLVDGAMLNNLPVDVMRAQGVRRVIAVDVGMEEDISAHMAQGQAVVMPGLVKSMMRVIELGGLEKARQARHVCDLVIQPPIQSIGLMEFERRAEIIQLGYEAGKLAIEDILRRIEQSL